LVGSVTRRFGFSLFYFYVLQRKSYHVSNGHFQLFGSGRSVSPVKKTSLEKDVGDCYYFNSCVVHDDDYDEARIETTDSTRLLVRSHFYPNHVCRQSANLS
jgi:hypothetical protein